MYLESDEKHGFEYLKAVLRSLERIKNEDGTKNVSSNNNEKPEFQTQQELEKLREQYDLLDHWFQLKQQNRSVSEYFIENHYDQIALYGWGTLGKHLYEDLKMSKIEVSYIIDQNKKEEGIVAPEAFLEDQSGISVIVVTPIFAYEEVYKKLCKKVDVPVISLQEVVMSL